jgi:hypothetical protein
MGQVEAESVVYNGIEYGPTVIEYSDGTEKPYTVEGLNENWQTISFTWEPSPRYSRCKSRKWARRRANKHFMVDVNRWHRRQS